MKISVPTLERWVRDGLIPVVKLGRPVLLRKESLDAVSRQHEHTHAPAVEGR